MTKKRFAQLASRLVKKSHFELRPDLKLLLTRAFFGEKNVQSRKALGWILQNAQIAQKQQIALCQDTGFAVLFIELGKNVFLPKGFVPQLEQAIIAAYQENFLRASAVDPLCRVHPSYQAITSHIESVPSLNGVTISLLVKGFGSENKTALYMFQPTATQEDIENFVVDSARKAGPEACPPFIIGVGIGSTAEGALLLAKKSLLGDLTKNSTENRKLEMEILRSINNLRIGPMGFGGNCTALAVKVLTAKTHIAGLPVGVSLNCWALRSASIHLDKL